MWVFFNGLDQETGRLQKGDENTSPGQVLRHRPFSPEDKYMKPVVGIGTGDEELFGDAHNNPDYNESEQVAVEIDKIREQRQPLLDETDYALLEDFKGNAKSKSDIKAYRQALRDMVNGSTTMADVAAITFPSKPAYVEDTKWEKEKNLDFSSNNPVNIEFTAHGLSTGNSVEVVRSNNETGLELGEYSITVVDVDNFTVPFDGDGNGGKCDISYDSSQ